MPRLVCRRCKTEKEIILFHPTEQKKPKPTCATCRNRPHKKPGSVKGKDIWRSDMPSLFVRHSA
jgi:hypothetical protein